MKEFIKALVSKNKSNIVPAEHNLFGMGHRTKRFFQWSGKMGERF